MNPTEAQGVKRPEPTGERLLTQNLDSTALEHLHRYAFALPFSSGKDVMDVASGEGYGAALIAKVAKRVCGVDISREIVAWAKAKYGRVNLDFIAGSASEIPLERSVMDLVVSFETIEHHAEHAQMMSEIKRILRPDGLLIISSPDKGNYTEIAKISNPHHVKELYKEEFHSLIREHFANVAMLSQRLVYGSLIAPEDDARGFAEFWGDYSRIQSAASLRQSVYNICLASDAELPSLPVSFYEGSHVLDVQMQSVLTSRSYRLGRALTWPLRSLLKNSGQA